MRLHRFCTDSSKSVQSVQTSCVLSEPVGESGARHTAAHSGDSNMPYQREFKLTVVARDAEDFRYALESAMSYVHSQENRQQIDSQSDPWEQPVITPYADATLSFGPVVKTPDQELRELQEAQARDPAPIPPPAADTPSVVVHQDDFRSLYKDSLLPSPRRPNLLWLRVLQDTPPEQQRRLYLAPDPNVPDNKPACWVRYEDRALIGKRPVRVLVNPPHEPTLAKCVGLYMHAIEQLVEDIPSAPHPPAGYEQDESESHVVNGPLSEEHKAAFMSDAQQVPAQPKEKNYELGAGRLYFDRLDGRGSRYIGNTPGMRMSIETETERRPMSAADFAAMARLIEGLRERMAPLTGPMCDEVLAHVVNMQYIHGYDLDDAIDDADEGIEVAVEAFKTWAAANLVDEPEDAG